VVFVCGKVTSTAIKPLLTPLLPPLLLLLLLLLLLPVACVQSVRTETICRMLVIPRTVYTALTDAFPVSTRQIMTNLVDRAEQVGGQ
jgi:hypothetical protein